MRATQAVGPIADAVDECAGTPVADISYWPSLVEIQLRTPLLSPSSLVVLLEHSLSACGIPGGVGPQRTGSTPR